MEYNPAASTLTPKNPNDAIKRHIDEYVQLISTPSTDNNPDFDIIVFPEGTLNTIKSPATYPDQHANSLPCTNEKNNNNENSADEDLILQSISCAAKNSRRYVIINITTKRNCTAEKIETNDPRDCSPTNVNLYNTNVVFDRTGTIIST